MAGGPVFTKAVYALGTFLFNYYAQIIYFWKQVFSAK
jgi:hypothetical protein